MHILQRQIGNVCTYFKVGVLVTAQLQVSIALLVVIHMHSLSEGVSKQASLHSSEASVRLRHMDTSHCDAISWFDRAGQLALQLEVQAAWSSTLRYLHAMFRDSSACTCIHALVQIACTHPINEAAGYSGQIGCIPAALLSQDKRRAGRETQYMSAHTYYYFTPCGALCACRPVYVVLGTQSHTSMASSCIFSS